MRAMRPARGGAAAPAGLETGELGVEPVENSLGELVGEIVADSCRGVARSVFHIAAIPL